MTSSQSLFYWITYSYNEGSSLVVKFYNCLNPYFIGLPILIFELQEILKGGEKGLNPYFIGLPILIFYHKNNPAKFGKVSILILLDYLFL